MQDSVLLKDFRINSRQTAGCFKTTTLIHPEVNDQSSFLHGLDQSFCYHIAVLWMVVVQCPDHNIGTLKSMGMRDSTVKRIFVLEGWMISLLGLAAGLVLGIGFSLLQQHFGFIKMPGNFVVQAYPVILSAKDVIITAASVAAVGWIIAKLPAEMMWRRKGL